MHFLEAWINFPVPAFLRLCLLFHPSDELLLVVTTYVGWVNMCVPFHYVRSRYIQMVLCWFHPLYGGSCRPFVGPIVAFPIGFSSGNGLDLPLLGSFSLGYPLSTWTSFRGPCFYALLARYDVRLAVCSDAQTGLTLEFS